MCPHPTALPLLNDLLDVHQDGQGHAARGETATESTAGLEANHAKCITGQQTAPYCGVQHLFKVDLRDYKYTSIYITVHQNSTTVVGEQIQFTL